MAEYTDIPPIPFSLNKAIDSRDCKPLRKKNSVFIDAKFNAASKGVLAVMKPDYTVTLR